MSLFVLNKLLSLRAKASLLKGATMVAFGELVLGFTVANAWRGVLPSHTEMGIVALLVNVVVAVLLYAFRDGDSNNAKRVALL